MIDPDGRAPWPITPMGFGMGMKALANRIQRAFGYEKEGYTRTSAHIKAIGDDVVSLGRVAADEFPGVGEAISVAEGDYVGAAAGLIPGGKKIKDAIESASDLKKGLKKYEVGDFDDLQKRSEVGDDLDLHHVPQKHPAAQKIENYDSKKGPAIAIPKKIHKSIPTIKGISSGSARDQLAKDARNLRNAEVPNEKVKEVIDYNKNKYPNAYKKE